MTPSLYITKRPMKSIIYEYVSKEDPTQMMLGVGSERQYIKEITQNAIQVVRTMKVNHNERRRNEVLNMSAEELLYNMNKLKDERPLEVIYPN